MSALNIRSWADLRAFLYVVWPVLATLCVTYGVFGSEQEAALWSGLVLALLGPVTAFLYSRGLANFRAAFYAVLAAAQALAIGYGLVTEVDVSNWLPLVSAVIGLAGGGVAAANTDTTFSGPIGSNQLPADAPPE